MGAGYPTRLTYGIATVAATKPLGNYPLPDPFHSSSTDGVSSHSYANDFNTLPATDFTLTGAGTPTMALGSGAGGVVVLTTTATLNDSALATKAGKAFAFVSGYKAWGLFRFQVSDATNPSFIVGLLDAASQADGLYFSKAAGATSVDLVSMVGGVATTLVSAVATAADATYLDLGWYYTGSELIVYSGDAVVARVTSGTLTTALLTMGLQIVNGAAAAKTMTVDYVFAAEELVR